MNVDFRVLPGLTEFRRQLCRFDYGAMRNVAATRVADYHMRSRIVRNSSRSDIPHRTIIEAAQLAAKFSQARKDSKVSIHYARRKFLTKPKGSAPGLVRMSSFKTVTVEPGENLERIK